MDEFALKNYGYTTELISIYSRQKATIKQFYVRDEEHQFKKDKKLDVVYRVMYRYKNNDEKREFTNNEVMGLEIDQNLSPDFTASYVDMVKQESLTLTISMIEQPRTFQTKLHIMETYVSPEQELFENKTFIIVPTLPGTLAKRMQHYKDEFQANSKLRIERFLKEGFQTNERHLLSNFADYLYLKWNENSGNRISDINKILTMYSALHDDCFHNETLEYDYHRFPYAFADREVNYRPKKPFLFAYQSKMLDELNDFFNKNSRAFEEMHNRNCNKIWSGSKLKYYEFKKDFLEMWNAWKNQRFQTSLI